MQTIMPKSDVILRSVSHEFNGMSEDLGTGASNSNMARDNLISDCGKTPPIS